ncbi:MAG: hypothetical protein ACOZNI_04775 [Myxococcota bacterium]
MRRSRTVIDLSADPPAGAVDPVEPASTELAPREPPAAQALSPWRVELRDGQIVVGDAVVHPVVARDLWARLGQLVAEAERDSEQAEWTHLSRELDRQFRLATPASARTLAKPSTVVEGLVLRESEDAAIFRLATFSIATLRRGRKGWEGPAWALRPNGFDRLLRPLGFRVRVHPDAVPPVAVPRALPGPSPTPRPGTAPRAPEAPAGLLERRQAIAEAQRELLEAFGEVGTSRTLDELAERVPARGHELRAQLDTLVEQGELAVAKPTTPGEPARWTRLDRQPLRPPWSKRGATRLAKAPRRKAAPRPAKPKPPAHPSPLSMRCSSDACRAAIGERVVAVPPERAAGARCRFCGSALARVE